MILFTFRTVIAELKLDGKLGGVCRVLPDLGSGKTKMDICIALEYERASYFSRKTQVIVKTLGAIPRRKQGFPCPLKTALQPTMR
jgi:hypothetical protein